MTSSAQDWLHLYLGQFVFIFEEEAAAIFVLVEPSECGHMLIPCGLLMLTWYDVMISPSMHCFVSVSGESAVVAPVFISSSAVWFSAVCELSC